MQKLAEICVHRPVFASMLIAAITVVGGVSFFTLGVDRYPRVETPVVSVTTTNPGATPENMETEITDRIEAAVNTISGIDELRSVSSEGVSQVFITFTLDKDIVPRDTPVGNRIAYLTREPASPFARMSDDMLVQPVHESGTVQVGERTCTLYTFGDTGGGGDAIRYELALDENDLPCQVVQRAGGFQNSSVYEINTDGIQILAPDAGTPVSGTPEG